MMHVKVFFCVTCLSSFYGLMGCVGEWAGGSAARRDAPVSPYPKNALCTACRCMSTREGGHKYGDIGGKLGGATTATNGS